MELLLKLSNGNYFFVQDSTEGGWDYYYLDGNTHRSIDGGLYESEKYLLDNELVKEILHECGRATPYEKELANVTWEEETELDFWEDFED